MTQEFLYGKIKRALEAFGSQYYHWDGLHVNKIGTRLYITFDLFCNTSRVLRYMDEHGLAYVTHNGTRGGYTGGGNYREFTNITLIINK